MTKTYVYQEKENAVEVKLTGREAVKSTTSGKSYMLFEIEPVDKNAPGPKWTKWVRFSDLFEIIPTKPTPPLGREIKEGEQPDKPIPPPNVRVKEGKL